MVKAAGPMLHQKGKEMSKLHLSQLIKLVMIRQQVQKWRIDYGQQVRGISMLQQAVQYIMPNPPW